MKGEDPPAERLTQPWEIPCDIPARNCIKCGKLHNMVITNTVDKTHGPIDICYHCLWEGFTIKYEKI